MREQAGQAATSLEDQALWRAVVTNRTDAMEQRTKAQVMESCVNDRQAQTEAALSWQQIMESDGGLPAISASFLIYAGEETEAQSWKVTCPRSNALLEVEPGAEPRSSSFPVLALFQLQFSECSVE